MNPNSQPYIGVAQCSLVNLIDAKGRERVLIAVHCPHCRGGLIIGVRGLSPLHMGNADALQFVEALRQGPTYPLLHESMFEAGRRTHVQRFRGTHSSWYMSFARDSLNCDFICSGQAPMFEPQGMHTCLTPEQREAFADTCFKELMAHAPDARA